MSQEVLGHNLEGYNKTGYSSNYYHDNPASIGWNMGEGLINSYAGLILKPKGGSNWRKSPSENKLKEGPIMVYQGFGSGPLAHEAVPVDIPKNSMFVFARNYASPACCPATSSTSVGCVCTTKNQRDLIGLYRGGNKTCGGSPDF